jgi:branched-chain amino acid transport system ATP-binding protein
LDNPLLEVKSVNIFYRDAQAVWDVSFQVERQKITVLLGTNGAGKSTLLNAISSVIQPKGGKILFRGNSLINLKPEKVVAMGISQVPEGRHLFSRLTVLENLELGAYLPNTRPLLKESLERVFSLFPVIRERKGQRAGSLSGGEQQMLAIARALMARPILLMLDEPSLGLAPIVVKLLFEIIKILNRDRVTILLVEQNVQKALEIADYGYVLKTGTLKMEGRAEALLMDSDFQHAFLGMMR